MIIKLSYTNDLDIPIKLFNNQGTAQPLQPHQKLELTFAVPDDSETELILIAQPG